MSPRLASRMTGVSAGDQLQGLFERLQALGAVGLVEGDVRLVAAGERQGLADHPPVLRQDGGPRLPPFVLLQARVQAHA